MNVVRFPVVPKERPQGEPLAEPVAIMTTALAHVEQLVSIYREVGARPNPVTILMMIASILEEPQLRKAANLAANLAAGFDGTDDAEVGQARFPSESREEIPAVAPDPRDNPDAEKAG